MSKVDQWTGCYPSQWRGIITPESFAHPAKFSSRLIERIYQHATEEGWLQEGDRVIDPFGGVALGAFPALRYGLDWQGCELEQRFVDLGNENIALWNERYAGKLPRWGSARLLQGDSRSLAQVIVAAQAAISSPPYADSIRGGESGIDWSKQADRETEHPHGYNGGGYSEIAGCISSPPYADITNAGERRDPNKAIESELLIPEKPPRVNQSPNAFAALRLYPRSVGRDECR